MSDTRAVVVETGVRHEAARLFRSWFESREARLVADENTFRAAGADVLGGFAGAAHPMAPPIVFGTEVRAEYRYVDELRTALAAGSAVPVAVGSGTLNDLTKLAAHQLSRPYVVVATAASMDGYTAFGASITRNGFKQTFPCPAPYAVLADLETLACAPAPMNSAGYADLLAKNAAGADWILADAAGEERLEPEVWRMVHGEFDSWVHSPERIPRRDAAALRRLIHGLLASGFAMQAARSSRPASGAEHHFSHLWEMQGLACGGAAPSHGFKVGIGTLMSLALYEQLLGTDPARIDPAAAAANWPDWEVLERRIPAIFPRRDAAGKALEETRAKHIGREALGAQLARLRRCWPELRGRLARHLIPFAEARRRLEAAGCPVEPGRIGLSRERLRESYRQAFFIRRRFTILDLTMRLGILEELLEKMFGPGGVWAAGTWENSQVRSS